MVAPLLLPKVVVVVDVVELPPKIPVDVASTPPNMDVPPLPDDVGAEPKNGFIIGAAGVVFVLPNIEDSVEVDVACSVVLVITLVCATLPKIDTLLEES